MYAGRVACCPLVSHVKYAPRALLTIDKNALRALLRLEKDGTNGRTDGRTDARPLHIRSLLDPASVMRLFPRMVSCRLKMPLICPALYTCFCQSDHDRKLLTRRILHSSIAYRHL